MWLSVETPAAVHALWFAPEVVLPRSDASAAFSPPSTGFAVVGGGPGLPPLGNPPTKKQGLFYHCSLKSSFVKFI